MLLQWRGSFHGSPVQSLLLQRHQGTTQWSLISASSNGMLVETQLGVSADSVAGESQQQQLLHWDVKNPAFCLLAASDLVFAGMAKNEVKAWRRGLGSNLFPVGVQMDQHTGWVRAMASHKSLVFTASCNFIKVWQLQGAAAAGTVVAVNLVAELQLFKGDILALAVSEHHVFCGASDGFLHSWELPRDPLSRNNLRFRKVASVKAHSGRVTCLLLCDDDEQERLLTAGEDGHIRAWSGDKLIPLGDASTGDRIDALVRTGACIFSSGHNGCIRKWDLPTLSLRASYQQEAASTLAAASNVTSESWLLAAAGAHGEISLWSEDLSKYF